MYVTPAATREEGFARWPLIVTLPDVNSSLKATREMFFRAEFSFCARRAVSKMLSRRLSDLPSSRVIRVDFGGRGGTLSAIAADTMRPVSTFQGRR